MTKLVDIREFKEDKKNKLILKDVNSMIGMLDKVSNELFRYKKYRYIKDILYVVETNKNLLELARNKFMKGPTK